MRARWWVVHLVVGLAAIAAYVGDPADAEGPGWAVVAAGTGVALLAGPAVHRPSRRGPWRRLLASIVVSVAGGAMLGAGERVPLVAALCLVGAEVLLALALLWFVRLQAQAGDRDGVIDAVVVGVVVAAVVVGGGAAPSDPADALVDVVIPSIQAVLVALSVRLLFLSGARAPSIVVLAALGASRLVAGAVPALLPAADLDVLVTALWMAGFLAVQVAAVHPSMVGLTLPAGEPDGRLALARVAVLGCALAGGTLGLVAQAGLLEDPSLPTAASGLVAVLVLLRILGLVGERERARSTQVAMADEARHRAAHDALTGLPNRQLFGERIAGALETHRGDGAALAVLVVDLDDFQTVNDSLGHEAGDRLLVTAADRIRDALRPGDTAARLGGDEFGVLLEHPGDERAAVGVAERIQAALAEPIELGTRAVRIGASIGIARDDGSSTPGQLLRDADTATYTAKGAGKGGHQVFRPAMHDQAVRRLELKGDLHRALRDGELFVEYQPIVDLASQRVVGAEALARWRHPDRGLIGPTEFIPLAEESDVIVVLGAWVLREACATAATWGAAVGDAPAPTVSVNLSPRQLVAPGIVAEVTAALADSGLPASRLVLELTESAVLTPRGVPVLAALKAMGVRLAIDDFGTGYSSLSQLQRLRPDILKIDRSFVAELHTPGGSSLAQGILRLARTLDVVTVAEGIEAEAQASELAALHCDLGQGFHLGSPLSPGELLAVLRGGNAPAPAP